MILVTGANGLVGAAIARALLKQGETVRALRRPTSDLTWAQRYFEFHGDAALWAQLNWVEGDVLDVPSLESAITGCDRVFHAAAMVSFHPKDSTEMLEINGTGTANVVNVCLAQQVSKLCYVSSTAALGRSKAGEAIDENRTWENSRVEHPLRREQIRRRMRSMARHRGGTQCGDGQPQHCPWPWTSRPQFGHTAQQSGFWIQILPHRIQRFCSAGRCGARLCALGGVKYLGQTLFALRTKTGPTSSCLTPWRKRLACPRPTARPKVGCSTPPAYYNGRWKK